MPIERHDSFPKLTRWQRWLRKLFGARDMVAVVFITQTGQNTMWFTGIDMSKPSDMSITTEIEKLQIPPYVPRKSKKVKP